MPDPCARELLLLNAQNALLYMFNVFMVNIHVILSCVCMHLLHIAGITVLNKCRHLMHLLVIIHVKFNHDYSQ